jgi:signal transduction histidine kinase
MMRRLKQSVDENRDLLEQIKTFNLELRGKVEAATAELAAKNTQLEGANERLLNLQRRLTSLEKLATLGEIATIIAHELGTPLNAISGHLQLCSPTTCPIRMSSRAPASSTAGRPPHRHRPGRAQGDARPAAAYNPIDVRRVIRDVVDLFTPTARSARSRPPAAGGDAALAARPTPTSSSRSS